ncbi:hypothetical protein JL720_13668 [Aureococcus anophagefferens]|nr:hypothetical protein JL720_13668 [Aureococcus anophagefferens]
MRHSMRCAGCCVVALAAAARVHEPSLWRGHLGAPGGSTYAKIFGPGGWYADPLLWGSGDDLGCMGAPAASGRQIFLPETHENGSVAIPRRAGDVRCYAKTKARGSARRAAPARCGSRRPKTRGGEWHSHRFKTIPSYDEDEERAVLQRLVDLFLAHGACGVETRLYDLARRPPQMPSSFSGANPGKSLKKARFQLVWPSYALHLLVHSAVWADVERYERATTSAFDFVVKMRADAGWLADAPAPGVTLEGSAVVVKECLDWGGLNDKLAIVPRKYAAPWMRLLEAYYDDVAADYKNSEQFQLRLAHAFHVPVRKEPTALAMQDVYFWLPDARGRPGCFPWNYAGLKPNGHCLCVADRECAAVGDRALRGSGPWATARPGA